MLTPITLRGKIVTLEPMSLANIEELYSAASEDRSTYTYTSVPNSLDTTKEYIEAALIANANGRALPFVVHHNSTNRIVGSTRFLDIEVFSSHTTSSPTVVEIGNTWYASSVQQTGVNTECKLLLLTYAFETWNTIRVTLKTDARNNKSRAAIERIGAAFEGIRRAHMPAADGGIRDTAYYSIIADEWPGIRNKLEQYLQAH